MVCPGIRAFRSEPGHGRASPVWAWYAEAGDFLIRYSPLSPATAWVTVVTVDIPPLVPVRHDLVHAGASKLPGLWGVARHSGLRSRGALRRASRTPAMSRSAV